MPKSSSKTDPQNNLINLWLKSVFFKNVLQIIGRSKKNHQNCPGPAHWFRRGSFCKFLDQPIFQSTFLKNRLYWEDSNRLVAKWFCRKNSKNLCVSSHNLSVNARCGGELYHKPNQVPNRGFEPWTGHL